MIFTVISKPFADDPAEIESSGSGKRQPLATTAKLFFFPRGWFYSSKIGNVHFSFALTRPFFMLTYGTDTVGTSSDDSSGEEENDEEESGDSGKRRTLKLLRQSAFIQFS